MDLRSIYIVDYNVPEFQSQHSLFLENCNFYCNMKRKAIYTSMYFLSTCIIMLTVVITLTLFCILLYNTYYTG